MHEQRARSRRTAFDRRSWDRRVVERRRAEAAVRIERRRTGERRCVTVRLRRRRSGADRRAAGAG